MEISFVIPTLNSEKVLDKCLNSIVKQKYPHSDYEILIIDGGSTDKTKAIAKKYKTLIVSNPLKTAEAGKAIGIKKAKGKLIALIDSDNMLPKKDWLQKMVLPFKQNKQIIGSEPLEFTYRKQAGFFERYSALIGANDPYAFVSGIYDRKNYINNKWTNLKIDQIDKKPYILIKLKPDQTIPTIGANGTVFKAPFLKRNLKSDYLFDIDMISQALKKNRKPIYFAKIKTGIIHTFCEDSFKKFINKQRRRLVDFYIYKNQRQYDWTSVNKYSQIRFFFYTILVFPGLIDSIRGFSKKPDFVWFLHPIICFITLLIYIDITIKNKLGLLKPINRKQWHQ